MNDVLQIARELHAAWEAASRRKFPRAIAQYDLGRLAAHGATAEDMTLVVEWTLKKIAETQRMGDRAPVKRFPASLAPRILFDEQRFFSDLGMAQIDLSMTKKQAMPAGLPSPAREEERPSADDFAAAKRALRSA